MPRRLELEGLAEPIHVMQRRNARRVTLSVNPATRRVTLTAPPGVSDAQLRAFAEKHRRWLDQRVAQMLDPIQLVDGIELPFRGQPHQIEGVRGNRVRLTGQQIEVGADGGLLAERLMRWLKREARLALTERSSAHARTLDVRFSKLAIKDTRSRWGSCSSSGTLSYSWRVILAPEEVLDYLAAHEVAHLREMNHGPNFWAHVAQLCPDYRHWQDWLRQNGQGLHRFQM